VTGAHQNDADLSELVGGVELDIWHVELNFKIVGRAFMPAIGTLVWFISAGINARPTRRCFIRTLTVKSKIHNFLKNPNNQDIKNRKYTVKWRGCGFGVVKNHTIRLCSLKLS
jgi:hypothetical protein